MPPRPWLPEYKKHFDVLGPKVLRVQLQMGALVVPTVRGAKHLERMANLAYMGKTPLVALCSGETKANEVMELFGDKEDLPLYAVDVPSDHEHEAFDFRAYREIPDLDEMGRSDLGRKRNIGRELAKVVGLFDDDTWLELMALIEACGIVYDPDIDMVSFEVGGMHDKSVLYHAHEVAESHVDRLPDGNIHEDASGNLTGAGLVMDTDKSPGHFAEENYNEDWQAGYFSIGRIAIAQSAVLSQDVYNPYASPKRARREEFGDTFAEGLYNHIQKKIPAENLHKKTYWSATRAERRKVIEAVLGIISDSHRLHSNYRAAIVASLEASLERNQVLQPENYVGYYRVWQEDQARYEKRKRPAHKSIGARLRYLDLGAYTLTNVKD